jgi:hypothetical protein
MLTYEYIYLFVLGILEITPWFNDLPEKLRKLRKAVLLMTIVYVTMRGYRLTLPKGKSAWS